MPHKSHHASQESPTHYTPRSLTEIDPDEKEIVTIRRHPFGIIVLYLQVGLGLAAAIGLIYFLLPNFVDPETTNAYAYIATGIAVIGLFMLLLLFIATIIYRQSRLIVTDKTITQVIQEGLFNRKISQLSIADIEDVTANRNGFFKTIFNFGDLNVETAGEQVNFHFIYCPNPNYYARQILEASERFLHGPE